LVSVLYVCAGFFLINFPKQCSITTIYVAYTLCYYK
jgi:hypothetical protein